MSPDSLFGGFAAFREVSLWLTETVAISLRLRLKLGH
jgi:hypothetical protein